MGGGFILIFFNTTNHRLEQSNLCSTIGYNKAIYAQPNIECIGKISMNPMLTGIYV